MREGGSRNLLYSKSLHKTRGPIDVAVGSQPTGVPWDEWGHGWRGLWSDIYLQLLGGKGAGSCPSWRSSPAQIPSICLCVCVRERVSEWERVWETDTQTPGMRGSRGKITWEHNEKTAICKSRGGTKETALPTPWSLTFSLWNCDKMYSRSSSHPVCGTWLWLP